MVYVANAMLVGLDLRCEVSMSWDFRPVRTVDGPPACTRYILTVLYLRFPLLYQSVGFYQLETEMGESPICIIMKT